MRCNSAATEETFVVKLFINEASLSSVVSYIGRITDGYECTLGINTATVAAGSDVITIGDTIVICCITRDDTAGEFQCRAIVSKDATARSSLVSRDHAACHFEAGIRARYAQTTAPATAVAVGDVTARNIDSALRENDVTVVAQVTRRCDHASVEVKRTAVRNRNDSFDRTAVGCGNDCAETADNMLSRSLGGAKFIFIRRARGFIIG